MKLQLLLFTLLLSMFLRAQTVTVAVAANVSYAIGSLQKAFKIKYPNTKVQVILGSSGKLTALIKNGAPYDILMAANMAYPNALYKDALCINKPKIYAQGSLALLTTKELDLSKEIAVIEDPNVKKIAITNPKTAPYGKAALEALQNAKLYSSSKEKLVFAETVSQSVAYTLRVADIGFIAKSALFSPKMQEFKEGRNWVSVDSKLYTPIDQGVVVLKRAKDNSAAKEFYNFLFSNEAKDIFKKFGYMVP